jgi:hypothetical protein|tara:strand:+ start:130 stop:357 length:228 start_codon:yes stop_codon:yes gene_type:complete
MVFRKHLKATIASKGVVRGRRWFTKVNKNGTLKEIKMVFHPEDYAKANPNRKLYGDRKLLEILEKNKELLNEIDG